MTYHHCTVRIAEDDLRTHIYQFIHEEETALEHLLMEKHTSASLGCHHEEHRQEVWRKSWPWCICQGHDGAINERVDHIVLLFRNEEVIALYLHLHTESAEGIRNDTQVLHRHILDADAGSTHGSHTDEGTHLDHIRQDAMLGTMQLLHTHDGEQIAGNATDLGTHRIEQVTELLDVWFAGCIIDGGGSLGKNRRHDDVGSTGNRSLIEQHIASLQLLGLYLIYIALLIVHKIGTQVLESQEVGIKTAAADFIATRLGDGSLAESSEQGSEHQYTATQRRTLLHELQTVEIIQFQLITLEGIIMTAVSGYLHTDFLEQLNQVVHIQDVRHIGNAHGLIGKNGSTDHLQRLVLGSLRGDGTLERMTALYDERLHKLV